MCFKVNILDNNDSENIESGDTILSVSSSSPEKELSLEERVRERVTNVWQRIKHRKHNKSQFFKKETGSEQEQILEFIKVLNSGSKWANVKMSNKANEIAFSSKSTQGGNNLQVVKPIPKRAHISRNKV
eukprot:CAMPEP_0196996090 /NCGR_PEP_ID=MMETSP1380-20130617/2067_1 /TAXON_ID=5936 /ORGANISM="Euplotes crassus, Strain CT5" /LENGTH=128 /DNA_ID=CAMNT_0042411963 /DNA_START=102 /DNA_END=488 /DNA_ORIENTATION=-